jgi:hypothetical protein
MHGRSEGPCIPALRGGEERRDGGNNDHGRRNRIGNNLVTLTRVTNLPAFPALLDQKPIISQH